MGNILERQGALRAHNYGKEIQRAFGGMNHTPAASDGEICDMENMTADFYPLLASRPKRRTLWEGEIIDAVAGHDQYLFWVAGGKLYAKEAFGKRTRECIHVWEGEKRIAFLNHLCCIWPDKIFYDERAVFAPTLENGRTEKGSYAVENGKLYEHDGSDWQEIGDVTGNLEAEWSGGISIRNGSYAGVDAEANTIVHEGADFDALFSPGDALTISGCWETQNNRTAVVREVDGDSLRFYENTFRIPMCCRLQAALRPGTYYLGNRRFSLGNMADAGSRVYRYGENVAIEDPDGNRILTQSQEAPEVTDTYPWTGECKLTADTGRGVFSFRFGEKSYRFSTGAVTLKSGMTLLFSAQEKEVRYTLVSEGLSGTFPAEEGTGGRTLSFAVATHGIRMRDGMQEVLHRLRVEDYILDFTPPRGWEHTDLTLRIAPGSDEIYAESNDPDVTFVDTPWQGTLEREELQETEALEGYREISVRIARAVPDLEIVFQAQNRLWGCERGTILCCNLGNPRVWHDYDGLADGSWAVEVTEGEITGGVYYHCPIFMTEGYIYKIYGDYPADFELSATATLGCRDGCGGSMAIAAETLFYLSPAGFMAYSGGYPYSVDEALGVTEYAQARAGSDGRRYYVSCEERGGSERTLVYDTRYRTWSREDAAIRDRFAYAAGRLWMARNRYPSNGAMLELNARDDNSETVQSWAEFGDYVAGTTNRKLVKALILRLELEGEVRVLVSYEDGEYELEKTVEGNGKLLVRVPLKVKRTDRFRLKLAGTGDWKLYMLTREYQEGSDL